MNVQCLFFFFAFAFYFYLEQDVFFAYFHILLLIIFSFFISDGAEATYCVTDAVYWFVLDQ